MNNPNRKPRKVAPAPTPEEQAKILADIEARKADAKAERERIELYGKMLPKLSHRQLRGELRRAARRETHKEGYTAGLSIAFATVLSAVLDNTKTKENPNGRLNSYPS